METGLFLNLMKVVKSELRGSPLLEIIQIWMGKYLNIFLKLSTKIITLFFICIGFDKRGFIKSDTV